MEDRQIKRQMDRIERARFVREDYSSTAIFHRIKRRKWHIYIFLKTTKKNKPEHFASKEL